MAILLLLLTFPSETLPNAAIGRVVAVADGDTLTLLVNKRQTKIRLEGIDCPEKNQPHGEDAFRGGWAKGCRATGTLKRLA